MAPYLPAPHLWRTLPSGSKVTRTSLWMGAVLFFRYSLFLVLKIVIIFSTNMKIEFLPVESESIPVVLSPVQDHDVAKNVKSNTGDISDKLGDLQCPPRVHRSC